MDEQVNFDINESLKFYLNDPKTIPTPEADSELVYCEDEPESLTLPLINSALNPIVESIAENSDGIVRSSSFDTLQFLLKCAPSSFNCRHLDSSALWPSTSSSSSTHGGPKAELYVLSRTSSLLPAHALGKILDLLVSGLSSEADAVLHDLESDEQDVLQHHRQVLEMYGFLLLWAISVVEAKAAEHSTTTGVARRGAKGSKAKASPKDGSWDSTGQIQVAMEAMCKVMKLRLNKVFTTTSERDTFVNLFTRSVYLIMESEARIKATATRMFCFKVLCVAVKHHGHSFGAQTSIVQNLTYFEHLAEPMAEFLHILAEQYDYPQLAGETMRELTNKEFSPNDHKGPKSISAFLTKLSELEPRLVIKEMGLLAKFLDSEAYSLRCAVIEVCGNLVSDLSKQEERGENYKVQINAFFDTLEQRFLDTNPYCRCRAIQVYIKLCDLEQKFPKRRQAVTDLAVQSLQDKSSNVRRNAVKLVGKLVSTHPFGLMHGEQLSRGEWSERLNVVEAELSALKPPSSPGLAETAEGQAKVDSTLLDDATQIESSAPQEAMTEEQKEAVVKKVQEEAATSEAIGKLQLTKKYYTEALRFIESLHEASEIVCQLLSAKNKSEVIEAMDFFVVIDAFKVETAKIGIRKMLRLIWTKGNSDEGKGVQGHLIDCYRGLFFDAPESFSSNDAANFIARNMISLTFGASPAELTSLEQLLSTMVKGGHVSDMVINKLWQVYGVQKDISAAQRRGAIIVLGMIASADPNVVVKETETMMKIGLGPYGRSDLQLARYTCVALKRMIPAAKKAQERATSAGISRMSNEHAVLSKLAALMLVPSNDQDWFGMAEQAIGAIYVLSKHPDVLCSEILRQKTRIVFQHTRQASSPSGPGSSQDTNMIDGESQGSLPDQEGLENENRQKPSTVLSQLFFAVGHIAIKQIVHLELCELDFKRRKQEQEKSKPAVNENPSPRKSMGPATARKKKLGAAVEGKAEDEGNDELDMIGGTTEDDFTEAVTHIRERELLYGPKSLLANFGPLVTEICANNAAYADRQLQECATLCLTKLMCVSAEYCERNLPLLITILERSDDAIVRSNAVIALGDMAVCFNHLIDENTDFLYRRLNDVDGSVKRTCLMTLTFLILAGQVKVKGQLGEMAKCLEDGDRKIADLARMFFTELATKDNAVYNHFVDMFGLLSGGDRELDEDAFKRILKFLCGFIEKDKHSRALSEKLAARLPRAETERQWKDIAFAIGLLQQQQQHQHQHGGSGNGSREGGSGGGNREGGARSGGGGGGGAAINEEISRVLAAGFRLVIDNKDAGKGKKDSEGEGEGEQAQEGDGAGVEGVREEVVETHVKREGKMRGGRGGRGESTMGLLPVEDVRVEAY